MSVQPVWPLQLSIEIDKSRGREVDITGNDQIEIRITCWVIHEKLDFKINSRFYHHYSRVELVKNISMNLDAIILNSRKLLGDPKKLTYCYLIKSCNAKFTQERMDWFTLHLEEERELHRNSLTESTCI